jgi:hypothetical protein
VWKIVINYPGRAVQGGVNPFAADTRNEQKTYFRRAEQKFTLVYVIWPAGQIFLQLGNKESQPVLKIESNGRRYRATKSSGLYTTVVGFPHTARARLRPWVVDHLLDSIELPGSWFFSQ